MLSIVGFFEYSEYNFVGDVSSCGRGRFLVSTSTSDDIRKRGVDQREIDFMCLCLMDVRC